MRIKLGLGLVAALVFSVAMTASASAALLLFLSSAKAPLESLNVATQVFNTEAGTSECTLATIIAGESSGTPTEDQKATIQYGMCIAFGFEQVEISPAEYLFLASGLVHILKLISIRTAGCEVDVPAQSNLEKVDYLNAPNGKDLLLEPLVTGITYTAVNLGISLTHCLKTGTFSTGTYKGHSAVMIANGTLSFDP